MWWEELEEVFSWLDETEYDVEVLVYVGVRRFVFKIF